MRLVFHQCDLIQFVRDADSLGEPDPVTIVPMSAKFYTSPVAAALVFHLPFVTTLKGRWRKCLPINNFIAPYLFFFGGRHKVHILNHLLESNIFKHSNTTHF